MGCFKLFAQIVFVAALASAGCASVVAPPNGDGGGGTAGLGGSGGAGDTGGAGGIDENPDCGQGSLESNDTVDEATGVASGTVNGTCQFVGEEINCQGLDLLDEWFLTADQDGARTIELSWLNPSSDLDLAVFDVVTCGVLEVSVSRAGTQETINIFLADGTEVVIAVLAVDTNNSAEPYEVSVGVGTGANGI